MRLDDILYECELIESWDLSKWNTVLADLRNAISAAETPAHAALRVARDYFKQYFADDEIKQLGTERAVETLADLIFYHGVERGLIEESLLTESAVRQFKRVGTAIKRQYRCKSGPKAGKIVATPRSCATRKDPRKVRHGRKVARTKKGVRVRKTAMSKRKAISKMVTKMNKRLSGD